MVQGGLWVKSKKAAQIPGSSSNSRQIPASNSGGIEANWAVIPSTDSTGLRRGAERNQIAHAPECFLRGLLLYPLLTFTDPERFPGDTENAHNDFYPRTFVRNAADTLGAGMAGGKAFLGSNLDRLGI